MKVLAVIFLALVLQGCGSINTRDNARAFAYAGTTADFISTRIKLDEGCHENNPIYGSKQPSDGALAAGLLVSYGLVWFLDRQDASKEVLWFVGALRAGVAVKNTNVNCKGVPR